MTASLIVAYVGYGLCASGIGLAIVYAIMPNLPLSGVLWPLVFGSAAAALVAGALSGTEALDALMILTADFPDREAGLGLQVALAQARSGLLASLVQAAVTTIALTIGWTNGKPATKEIHSQSS